MQNLQTVLKASKKGVIIAIAREHGSAGKQIGKEVAEKLNIAFYYKEVAAQVLFSSQLSHRSRLYAKSQTKALV